MCWKTSWWGGGWAWLKRELWLAVEKKKRVYEVWKKGQAT